MEGDTIYKKSAKVLKQDLLFITLPQLLLIAVVASLLVLLVLTCIKSTKGPLSTAALKHHLLLLQSRFVSSALIDPEMERQEMERLQNKIKTSSDQSTISADKDLKQLFASNIHHIHLAMNDLNVVNKSSWIKFKAVMFDFNSFYFHA
jgi:hypothetical protein